MGNLYNKEHEKDSLIIDVALIDEIFNSKDNIKVIRNNY
jgi:hypothetical protein